MCWKNNPRAYLKWGPSHLTWKFIPEEQKSLQSTDRGPKQPDKGSGRTWPLSTAWLPPWAQVSSSKGFPFPPHPFSEVAGLLVLCGLLTVHQGATSTRSISALLEDKRKHTMLSPTAWFWETADWGKGQEVRSIWGRSCSHLHHWFCKNPLCKLSCSFKWIRFHFFHKDNYKLQNPPCLNQIKAS